MATNSRSNYTEIMQLTSKRAKKLMDESSLSARATVVKELLTETPVASGFLRNNIRVSAFQNEPVIPSSEKTQQAIDALPFQNLTYQDPPTPSEVSSALGPFERSFVNMYDIYVSLPVEYAQILVNNPKYFEFHRKAALTAQKKIDILTAGIFNSA